MNETDVCKALSNAHSILFWGKKGKVILLSKEIDMIIHMFFSSVQVFPPHWMHKRLIFHIKDRVILDFAYLPQKKLKSLRFL